MKYYYILSYRKYGLLSWDTTRYCRDEPALGMFKAVKCNCALYNKDQVSFTLYIYIEKYNF